MSSALTPLCQLDSFPGDRHPLTRQATTFQQPKPTEATPQLLRTTIKRSTNAGTLNATTSSAPPLRPWSPQILQRVCWQLLRQRLIAVSIADEFRSRNFSIYAQWLGVLSILRTLRVPFIVLPLLSFLLIFTHLYCLPLLVAE